MKNSILKQANKVIGAAAAIGAVAKAVDVGARMVGEVAKLIVKTVTDQA